MTAKGIDFKEVKEEKLLLQQENRVMHRSQRIRKGMP
jgi:hypothetical protein